MSTCIYDLKFNKTNHKIVQTTNKSHMRIKVNLYESLESAIMERKWLKKNSLDICVHLPDNNMGYNAYLHVPPG